MLTLPDPLATTKRVPVKMAKKTGISLFMQIKQLKNRARNESVLLTKLTSHAARSGASVLSNRKVVLFPIMQCCGI